MTAVPTRAAGVVFALLVAATIGAFFLAQRVKSTPATVTRFSVTPFCSPNGDGRFDGCRAAFLLKEADDVTVSVVGADGDVVDEVINDRSIPAYRNVRVLWRGTSDEGGRAPDGAYRFRVTLRNEGRSITLPRAFDLDTKAPRPVVTSIGPVSTPVPKAELYPNRQHKPLEINVRTPSTRVPTRVLVYRTDPRPSPEPVADLGELRRSGTVTWDGTRNGNKVQPGTYVVALATRDRAGNVGTTPVKLPPRAGYGQGFPGRGGITVRYLAVQPPLGEPVVAGEPADFFVDARGEPYTWGLRRAGEGRARKGSSGTRPRLRMQAPKGESGLFVLRVRTDKRYTDVPLAVQGLKRRRVLVVLPAILWQGRNEVDDDGDGQPNTLDRGLPALRDRVLAKGLPQDLLERVAPLLIFLDRQGLRYDLTTDLALADGAGPPLEGHRGVILAGDERWLPVKTQQALAAYVRRGGRVAQFGVDSLKRSVQLTRNRMKDPTTADATDAFGFELDRLVRTPATVTIAGDRIDLFRGDVLGGTGVFSDYPAYEAMASPPQGGRVVARATTADGKTVIVAVRQGRGLVIRTGLPDLPSRLSRPGNEADLVKRIWELLAQ